MNAAGKLFDKVFLNTEPTTFSVMVNRRYNNTFDRMKAINEIAELIGFKSPAHKVDLKNPKITIAIEVIKGICCVSLLEDYNKLKKYNIYELAQTKDESVADEEKKTAKNEEKKKTEDGQKEGETVEPQETENLADEILG